MSNSKSTKIFLDPDYYKEFSPKADFLAFGKGCEKVLEDFEDGKTLIILTDLGKASKGYDTGAFYSKGELLYSGDLKSTLKTYRQYLARQKMNDELKRKNKSTLEKLKKQDKKLKIKELKFLDEEEKEKYVFDPEEPFKAIIGFEDKNEFAEQFEMIMHYKEDLFGDGDKVLDLIRKVTKKDKITFELESLPIDEGEYASSFVCIGKNGKIEYEGSFEFSVISFKKES